jgi:hypothetical protein
VFWQVALVFGLIAVLSLVLRWVFSPPVVSRDPALPRRRPRLRLFRRRERSDDGHPPVRPTASPISPAATPRTAPPLGATTSPSDDYGLLAVAAEVGTADEATALRRLLTEAGIRSTSAVSEGGRHKVLVFGHELMRARRVAGRAQGGTQGAGSS